MDLENAGFRLSDAIETLREELALSAEKGVGKRLRLRLQDLKLELSVVASSKVGGKGGIKWLLLNAEASGEVSDAVTQRVTLTLEVIDELTKARAEIEGSAGAPGTRPGAT